MNLLSFCPVEVICEFVSRLSALTIWIQHKWDEYKLFAFITLPKKAGLCEINKDNSGTIPKCQKETNFLEFRPCYFLNQNSQRWNLLKNPENLIFCWSVLGIDNFIDLWLYQYQSQMARKDRGIQMCCFI